MKKFIKRYTIYVLILLGGNITGNYDNWVQWVGVAIAVTGWTLMNHWLKETE